MKNKLAKILALSFLIPLLAYGADEVIQSNKVKVGRKASSADKIIEIEQNAGVNNPQIYSTAAGLEIGLKTAKVKKGKGTAANIIDEFDIGLGATNPKIRWNNATGKIEFSNDGSAYTAIGSGGGGGGGGILLNANGGFEDGAGEWTASGGTTAVVTAAANVGFGAQSLSWDASVAAQTLSNTAVTVPAGLFGKVCSLSWYYKGGDANLKAQVYDGSSVIAESSVFSAQATYSAKQVLYFTCPSSGTIQARFIASANAAIIYIDDVKLGQETVLSSKVTEDYDWTSYTPAIVGFGTVSNLEAQHRRVGDSLELQIKFTSGTSTSVEARIPLPGALVTADASKIPGQMLVGWGVADTAGTSQPAPMAVPSVAYLNLSRTDNTTNPYTIVTDTLSSFGSSKRYSIFARVPIQGWSAKPAGATDSITIDKSGWYIDANIGGANISLSTSDVSTYTEIVNAGLDLVLDSGSAAAEIPCSTTNPSTGTTCAAGSPGVGIVFTPPTAGRYEVCASFTHDLRVSTGDGESTFEMVQTPNNAQTILARGGARQTSGMNANTDASGKDPHYLCGNFTLADTSKATFRVMYVNDNISGIAQNDIYASRATGVKGDQDIRFTVRRKVEFQDSIKFTNLVTTSRQEGLKTEIVRIAESGNIALKCSTNPCALFNNSGGFASATRASTGEYTLTINGGVFSQIPNCQAQGNGSSNVAFAFGTATSTTSYAISFRRATDAQPEDGYIDVTCTGF